jgi:beta-galactosidase
MSRHLLVLLGWACLTRLILGSEPAAASIPERVSTSSQSRSRIDFDFGWRFHLGDLPTAALPGFDDSGWREVDLPHDWSIEGPCGPEFAAGNGYAPGGIGWYRKSFNLDADAPNRLVAVEFDGIYNHGEVWINGHFVGRRPYGYSTFECDLTPFLHYGGTPNLIAVRVDHSRFADSRWYTGSGIYRHVHLRLTDRVYIPTGSTFVSTESASAATASLRMETEVRNTTTNQTAFTLQTELLAPNGATLPCQSLSGTVPSGSNTTLVARITVDQPQLWSLEHPQLYTLRQRLLLEGHLVDETRTSFGIRTFRFDADHGFFLNESPLKLKGVCLHHDAGCLGAAVPEKVLARRLRVLKELGVNAIRTSHNPPAPELLDLCDQMGFLVKDEAFDEFTPAKNKWVTGWNNGQPSRFGYAEDFNEWSQRDIQDMVRRDRNHPSIILWSIGNEIDYANDPFTHPVLGKDYRPGQPNAELMARLAAPLVQAVKALDTTRPVTAALANVAMSEAVGYPELLDIVGYNYQEWRYPADHAQFPKRVIFGSETGHEYRNWLAVRDNDYISGQFLWTGIDYLGEANRWPNHASAPGLLDLCGFKKPLAWFRQSLWSDRPMVYLCASPDGDARGPFRRPQDHWNWRPDTTLTVRCYTTCPEVRLTLNGRDLGSKKLANDAVEGALLWKVPYEPGILRADAFGSGSTPTATSAAQFTLKTAGPAHHVELLSDTTNLLANARDIAHLELAVVDAAGTRLSNATNTFSVAVDGPAKILGIENGDVNRPDSDGRKVSNLFHGRALAILQATKSPGAVVVTVTAPGLLPAAVTLESK